jgi:hypothetical protein
MSSAIQKLQPSRLSNQLETLNSDVDLASLNLAKHGEASYHLLSKVTAATIKRTIEGPSTLTITARDTNRELLRSGYIGKGLDCEIDGLWFRLWSWSKTGNDLQLTFIDREVAVLKEWPPTSLGAKMYRVWPASKYGTLTRFRFAEQLIRDVAHILPIRFVCPALGDQGIIEGDDPATKAANKGHGFPTNPDITVKNKKADRTQIANLQTVLDTGDSMGARRKVLIAAVAVVTQESNARASATNGVHVGLFQQDPNQGWPATRNPEIDAAAFFNSAIGDDRKNPNLAIEDLADDVQVSGHPELYKQWVDEATATVDLYLGNTDSTLPPSALVPTNAPDPTRGQFMRGRLETPSAAARKHRQGVVIVPTTQGNKQIIREDNWACLSRLASEIGYRCFCVSGTVYLIDDYRLFHQRVGMTLSSASDGIDSIDADFSQSLVNAKLTVACRVGRWQVPPGGVAAVEDMGPASGRWLASTIERSLFTKAATVTLQKPLESIPESAAPEHGAGASSGTQVLTDPPKTPGAAGSAPLKPTADTEGAQRVQIAQQLLKQHGIGWFDDNGRGLVQIQKVARGEKLDGAQGPVDLDTRTMRLVLWLIQAGYLIGTYAWCEDHSDDGPNGHAGGKAVDISSINGTAINQFTARDLTITVDKLIHTAPADLLPRQLISGGYGNKYDPEIASYCIPNAATFDYVDSTGHNVLREEHTNHIHVGYGSGGS